MTAAGPPRDSVLDALGYAIRVVLKPGYWWAPVLLTVIGVLPILAMPGMPGLPGGFGGGSVGAQPAFVTQAEMESYFRAFVPFVAGSVFLGIVLWPITTALVYRLAVQFTNGEAARPFAPGLVDLAWRFFLQTVVFLGLLVVGFLVSAVALVVAVTTGIGLVLPMTMIVSIVFSFFVFVRLAIAPALLASGAGPLESITKAWRMTQGRALLVLRWVLVTGLIITIAASVLGSVGSLVSMSFGQWVVGTIVSAAFAGPFQVVNAIVLVRLARLLSGPIQPPPQPELPAWMSASGSDLPV